MTTTMQANLKKQLSDKNMTAAELERRTGIPHAVVNILHGRSKNPSIRTAQAIAKELGCSIGDLINEPHSCQVPYNSAWRPVLYKQAFEAVYAYVTLKNLQPEAAQISACIDEVYTYTLGGQAEKPDMRFVEWIVNKSL